MLGSSGSLIPLLIQQIESGSPITITHPDMTRYFMLIPEAVSLVLRAATLSEPGDIAVLKMGSPVKIVNVARALLSLMGKTESENPLVFTGIRPGEKLFEELYLRGDELNTADPDDVVVPKGDLGSARFDASLFIQELRQLSSQRSEVSAAELQGVLGRYTEAGFPRASPEKKVSPLRALN